ncbi:MAG: HD domain-containing protein [Candidatus Dormibacteria bacterium]
MFTLEDAIALAVRAHDGQPDKGSGAPYITHCFRVMDAVAPFGRDYQITAVLHDAIEDTDLTVQDLLSKGCPRHIVEAILSVTKRPREDYTELVHRAALNPIGRIVKLADNLDNSSEERLRLLPPAMAERLRKKYKDARVILLGDPAFANRATAALYFAEIARQQSIGEVLA